MKTFILSLFAAIAAADDTEKIDKVVSTSTANEGGFEMKIVGDERVFKLYLQLLALLFRTHLIRSFHGNLPQPTLRIVSKLDSMRNALYVEGTMQ